MLASRLADWGADTGVHDAARVTRLPSSINSRTGRPVIYHPQHDTNGQIPTSTLAGLASFFHLGETTKPLPDCPPLESPRLPSPPLLTGMRATVETRATADRAVREGERNICLFKFACALRGQGVAQEEIRNKTHQRNQRLCKPPLLAWEVERLIKSALHYPPGSPDRRKLTWFPLAPRQFLRASHPWRVMTPIQRGWYFQLLLECWTNNGLLPSDLAVLWRLAGADTQAEFDTASGVVLQDFQQLEIGGQTCQTIESACAEICPRLEQKRLNGMCGGRPTETPLQGVRECLIKCAV